MAEFTYLPHRIQMQLRISTLTTFLTSRRSSLTLLNISILTYRLPAESEELLESLYYQGTGKKEIAFSGKRSSEFQS